MQRINSNLIRTWLNKILQFGDSTLVAPLAVIENHGRLFGSGISHVSVCWTTERKTPSPKLGRSPLLGALSRQWLVQNLRLVVTQHVLSTFPGQAITRSAAITWVKTLNSRHECYIFSQYISGNNSVQYRVHVSRSLASFHLFEPTSKYSWIQLRMTNYFRLPPSVPSTSLPQIIKNLYFYKQKAWKGPLLYRPEVCVVMYFWQIWKFVNAAILYNSTFYIHLFIFSMNFNSRRTTELCSTNFVSR